MSRSWRTRKGARKARGRQQADPGTTSVGLGAACKERPESLKPRPKCKRGTVPSVLRMPGADPTALPLRAPGWACPTPRQRRGRGDQEERTFGYVPRGAEARASTGMRRDLRVEPTIGRGWYLARRKARSSDRAVHQTRSPALARQPLWSSDRAGDQTGVGLLSGSRHDLRVESATGMSRRVQPVAPRPSGRRAPAERAFARAMRRDLRVEPHGPSGDKRSWIAEPSGFSLGARGARPTCRGLRTQAPTSPSRREMRQHPRGSGRREGVAAPTEVFGPSKGTGTWPSGNAPEKPAPSGAGIG